MKIDIGIQGGGDAFRKFLSAFTNAKIVRVRKLILSTALDIQRGAKQKLRENRSIDLGALRNSIVVETTPDGFTAEVGTVEAMAKYAPAVEYGTGPRTKFPPLEALEGWAKRHGFKSAWLVAKKIKERGTPAQPFLGPTADAILPFLEQSLAEALEKSEPGLDDGGSTKALI